ncbi:MAG: modular polyketide synthase, partial [bacterium]
MRGRSAEGLRAQAAALAAWLDARPPASLGAAGHALAAGRAALERGIGVVAGSAGAAADALRAWIDGGAHPDVVEGRRRPAAGQLAFVFPGQGSQWLHMGR